MSSTDIFSYVSMATKMTFDKMNEDMKLAIIDKMDLVNINDLRVCSWSTLNFVNRFAKRLEQKREVAKLIFEKGQMRWKFESRSYCAFHASQRVGKRIIKKLVIEEYSNIDQVIEFFRGSNATVDSLTFQGCFPETEQFIQILYLCLPSTLIVFDSSTILEDFSFLQRIPRFQSVSMMSFDTSGLVNVAPSHIPKLSLGENVCNTVPNTVIKKWLLGEQSLAKYWLCLNQFNTTEVFDGVDFTKCENDQCRHATPEEAEDYFERCSSAERCFRIARANGDYLNFWNSDQNDRCFCIVATLV